LVLGARHLVLLGRRGAASEEQRAAVAALEAAGARVTVAAVDVADREGLGKVLASGGHPPLRGVIHAAAVLEDGLLPQQSAEGFRRVLAPKLLGALHLDELTRGQPLDFFVLYSSAAALLGPPGQANYAAANAALDALAWRRRASGLPALSIDWGAFAEAGGAAASEERGARLARQGVRNLTPDEGHALLARLLDAGVTQVGAVPIDVRRWLDFYPQAAASPRFAELVASAPQVRAGQGAALRQQLQEAPPAERRRLLEKLLRGIVSSVLRLEPEQIDRRAPFKSLGIDSLMGLEMKNRLVAATGLSLPATLVWTYPTLASLVEHLERELGGGGAVAPAAPRVEAAPTESPAESREAKALASLSESEKEALLEKELADVEELLK
jgi:acyl carrier protein